MNAKIISLHNLSNALQPTRRAWKQAAGLVTAQHNISMALATVVIHVNRQTEGINQRDLAELVGVNPGALVRLLDQATEAGYLERREGENDRRYKTLHILPEGARLAQQLEDAADKLRLELMADVPQEDIDAATRILRLFEERALHYFKNSENE
ncbi:transcriptional regulator SlyA [Xenorhabdus mauleonii]|uniref:MarR family transcriptional regulator, transcriptional regulator for hemolysin n=1 Tax=Xenorhabdus mauleonii TaxID=351675 RepID=A0A1I3M4D2_9GAMM|nr:MarR family transcriptional regulator [Xenorhabdus mauleonii]PHM45397.1 transcriptional regulator SlyA [Xenorhabdus mauleonii]SFI91823.1 MarR family transcriptional regulator, transcriptional regulator for hemolysin [Xenorhabdus mauleonii]